MRYVLALALLAILRAGVVIGNGGPPAQAQPEWNPKHAAEYLDGRLEWWLSWPGAARDHGTSCVSCHTALPYALARGSLRKSLGEREPTAAESQLLDNVAKRVRLWRDVAPFYPDQTRGIPKTSESRGTESVLNALILAVRDAEAGALSEEGIEAFEALWDLQMKTGALEGAWAWLNFGLEPWEANESSYFGASLAAIAVGTAPGAYAEALEIQPQIERLRGYLRKGAASESLFNRLMILWASGTLSGVLPAAQAAEIVAAASAVQGSDGGWSVASLALWHRLDGSELDGSSDGFATALVLLAMQQAGVATTLDAFHRGREWLIANQDPATGAWPASSMNKQRDVDTDVGKFMSDAATAYAALVLSRGG